MGQVSSPRDLRTQAATRNPANPRSLTAQQPNSTVLHLPFVYVQGSQAVTSFPMVQASELVALQTHFSFVQDSGDRAATVGVVEDQRYALLNLR